MEYPAPVDRAPGAELEELVAELARRGLDVTTPAAEKDDDDIEVELVNPCQEVARGGSQRARQLDDCREARFAGGPFEQRDLRAMKVAGCPQRFL